MRTISRRLSLDRTISWRLRCAVNASLSRQFDISFLLLIVLDTIGDANRCQILSRA